MDSEYKYSEYIECLCAYNICIQSYIYTEIVDTEIKRPYIQEDEPALK